MNEPLSAAKAPDLVGFSYLPRGYGLRWIWRRLRIYLFAMTVACVIFLFWGAIAAGSLVNGLEGILLAVAATFAFFPRLRALAPSLASPARRSSNREV